MLEEKGQANPVGLNESQDQSRYPPRVADHTSPTWSRKPESLPPSRSRAQPVPRPQRRSGLKGQTERPGHPIHHTFDQRSKGSTLNDSEPVSVVLFWCVFFPRRFLFGAALCHLVAQPPGPSSLGLGTGVGRCAAVPDSLAGGSKSGKGRSKACTTAPGHALSCRHTEGKSGRQADLSWAGTQGASPRTNWQRGGEEDGADNWSKQPGSGGLLLRQDLDREGLGNPPACRTHLWRLPPPAGRGFGPDQPHKCGPSQVGAGLKAFSCAAWMA